jgi:hypothetical protein
MRQAHHLDTVAAKTRYGGGFSLLTPFNQKSPKGEKEGYLTAMMYLAPATAAGGRTVCPHSTPACQDGCLYSAGRGKTPRVQNARMRRTRMYLERRAEFMRLLVEELGRLQALADAHDMTLAIRLNGTADIAFEREQIDGKTVFDLFPRARMYDFTRIPARHRRVPAGWHLTFSVADAPISDALDNLRACRNVAVVMPREEFLPHGSVVDIAGMQVHMIDGELSDLRFLDPVRSIVQLKPKGRLTKGGPMVRRGFISDLQTEAPALFAVERWAAISGWEGRYEVSDHGRVRSLRTATGGRDRPRKAPKLRILRTGDNGYKTANLYKGYGAECRSVHTMVLDAFVGPRPGGLVGTHVDGTRDNNRLINLSWRTQGENMRDKILHGTVQRGENGSRVKLTSAEVAAIRVAEGLTAH